MRPNSKILFLLLLLQLPLFSFSQDVEMADTFRSDGKIYVVISVMSIIMAGIFVYLFYLERKISRMERKVNESK